ncbi:MAG: hypothetical protein ACE367_15500 [Acidimicrobiales bacterium]
MLTDAQIRSHAERSSSLAITDPSDDIGGSEEHDGDPSPIPAFADPAAVFTRVLTTPLADQFDRARFSMPLAGDGAVTGAMDLADQRFSWSADGRPVAYRNGDRFFARDEQYGVAYWQQDDSEPESMGRFLLFPWPGVVSEPSDAALVELTDPVHDVGAATIRQVPVRELVMAGTRVVGGDVMFGEEVSPEEVVDSEIHLFVDAELRPRRIDYTLWLFGEPIPVTMEFWDLDGDFSVDQPDDLDDPPSERPSSGPIGETSLRVELRDHDFAEDTEELVDVDDADVSFSLTANPPSYDWAPGELRAHVLSQPEDGRARSWTVTVLPADGNRVTPGVYPIVQILDAQPGTATLDLDEYFCSTSTSPPELLVHEVEYDEWGPTRFSASFAVECPDSGGQYYAAAAGELRINVLTG